MYRPAIVFPDRAKTLIAVFACMQVTSDCKKPSRAVITDDASAELLEFALPQDRMLTSALMATACASLAHWLTDTTGTVVLVKVPLMYVLLLILAFGATNCLS